MGKLGKMEEIIEKVLTLREGKDIKNMTIIFFENSLNFSKLVCKSGLEEGIKELVDKFFPDKSSKKNCNPIEILLFSILDEINIEIDDSHIRALKDKKIKDYEKGDFYELISEVKEVSEVKEPSIGIKLRDFDSDSSYFELYQELFRFLTLIDVVNFEISEDELINDNNFKKCISDLIVFSWSISYSDDSHKNEEKFMKSREFIYPVIEYIKDPSYDNFNNMFNILIENLKLVVDTVFCNSKEIASLMSDLNNKLGDLGDSLDRLNAISNGPLTN